MANIDFKKILSQMKQKVEDLNLKEKWSKFTLKLDQIPVPKWVLVIITFVSVVVAIVSLVSGGSNTNDSTSTNIKKSEETINGLVPGAEYLVDMDGWKNRMTLYLDGSAYSSLSGDCEWYYKSLKGQNFVVVDVLENTGCYYIDQKQNLYLNSVNSKPFKMKLNKK
jgi:hypothetical protein